MTTWSLRAWYLWFVVLPVVAGQPPVVDAGTLEDNRTLLVEWLTGELVAREDSSFMDRYVGEEIVVDGLREPALVVDEVFDAVAYELYGEKVKDWFKIRSFGSSVSEDLPRRMLENIGLSLYSVRTFSLEPESGSIVMRVWHPSPDGRRSLEDRKETTNPRHIKITSLTEKKGCGTRFRRRGAEFVGVPVRGTCAFATKDGILSIERLWRVTSEGFEMDWISRGQVPQSASTVRLSSLYHCEYFDLRLTHLEQRAFGFTSGIVKRIHDQNGSATFGPVTRGGETQNDVGGTGSPKFMVNLDRVEDWRVLKGARRWEDGKAEEAFEVRIPVGAREFTVELVNARLEMSAARPRSSDFDEIARLIAGSFSNRDQVDGNRNWEVVLHIAPIWTGKAARRWFYVEMAIGATPDEPFLQRVVDVGPGRDEWTIRWLIHKLDDPDTLVGLWRDPDRFDYGEGRSQLASSPCELVFQKQGEAWVSSSIRPCAPDPVEAFRWRLTPDRIQLMRFAYSLNGALQFPRQLLNLDRQ